jgi:AraC-like DNA-binding protein
MPAIRLAPTAEVSTDHVAPQHRLAYYEAYNAHRLVGLRCSALDSTRLQARQRHYDLGEARITDVSGSSRIIERSRELVNTHPKDAVFACLLLRGEACFLQAGRVVPLAAGDVVVYSTDVPYLYAFGGEMHQVIVATDAARLSGDAWRDRLREPLKLDGRLAAPRLLASALRSTAVGFLEAPLAERASETARRARALIDALVRPPTEPAAATAGGGLVLVMNAEQYIDQHLAEPDLDAQAVSRAVGVSLRHLNRLFAMRGESVSDCLWRMRLERARAALVDPRLHRVTVAEIAHRHGFASAAHFARAFRRRFGAPPTEHRSAALRGHH